MVLMDTTLTQPAVHEDRLAAVIEENHCRDHGKHRGQDNQAQGTGRDVERPLPAIAVPAAFGGNLGRPRPTHFRRGSKMLIINVNHNYSPSSFANWHIIAVNER